MNRGVCMCVYVCVCQSQNGCGGADFLNFFWSCQGFALALVRPFFHLHHGQGLEQKSGAARAKPWRGKKKFKKSTPAPPFADCVCVCVCVCACVCVVPVSLPLWTVWCRPTRQQHLVMVVMVVVVVVAVAAFAVVVGIVGIVVVVVVVVAAVVAVFVVVAVAVDGR